MIFSESAVWGHRGWPSRYPDNSEAGIRSAVTVVPGVEIDIRRTSDGRLVLSHDPELASHVVAETPWTVLASARLDGHPPALLEDVLDVEAILDLEVKNDPREPGFDATHRLALEVAEQARVGDVVTSFWWPSMDAVRRAGARVITGLLFEAGIEPSAAVEHAADRGHQAIVPYHDLVGAELMERARAEGIRVITWTVDDAREAMRLAELGVDAIITNRPGEIIAEVETVRNAT